VAACHDPVIGGDRTRRADERIEPAGIRSAALWRADFLILISHVNASVAGFD
jgi:hypothetical protein